MKVLVTPYPANFWGLPIEDLGSDSLTRNCVICRFLWQLLKRLNILLRVSNDSLFVAIYYTFPVYQVVLVTLHTL